MYPDAHTPFLINLDRQEQDKLDRQEQDKKYELIIPYDLSFLSNEFLSKQTEYCYCSVKDHINSIYD